VARGVAVDDGMSSRDKTLAARDGRHEEFVEETLQHMRGSATTVEGNPECAGW
jgi:hypothetical protein